MTIEEKLRTKQAALNLLQAEIRYLKAQLAHKQLKPNSHNANIKPQGNQNE